MDSAMHAIYLIFLLPINVLSQLSPPNVNTIALGSSLTATNAVINNSPWTSRSGDFAFGFIQPAAGTGTVTGTGGGYLLAIWFNKIPEKTVIWSANRDRIAPEGSTLQLVEDGRFVLNDPTGQNIWNVSIGGGGGAGVAYGVLLDTGNFVLASNTSSSSFLWQSFSNPTDTLLPSQSLIEGQKIVSSFSATNYTSGKFQLTNDSNGNLALYRIIDPLASLNFPYLTTSDGTFRRNGSKYLFNESGGIISLVSKNGSLINSDLFTFQTVSINHYYQRLTLDYDGLLRYYVYPKSLSTTGGMPMGWSILNYEPLNICLSMSDAPGGGICGYNGMCSWNTNNNNNKMVCQCLPGYSLKDPDDTMMGCEPNFLPQSCKLNETSLYILNDAFNTDWPSFLPVGAESQELEHYDLMTEEQCKQMCLNDCLCAVANFQGTDCYKKYLPLVNGRIDQSVRGKAMIKVRLANSTINPPPDPRKNSKSKTTIIIVCVVVALLVPTLAVCAYITRRRWLNAMKGKKLMEAVGGTETSQFDFASIRAATENFSLANKLGRGGFGDVYKGVLSNGKEIAVKRLSKTSGQGEKEFRNEVMLVAKLQHKCLVRLLGFCLEKTERLLVYEFLSNGSLDNILFDQEKRSRLDWEKRYRIIQSTAKGILYLHEDSRLRIIHRDLKASNVLLDDDMNAKISDFGLARLFGLDETEANTNRIAGTYGYMAPEYAMHGLFSGKSDVYSYGVLLLEIISGKRNYSSLTEERVEDLLSYAYNAWRQGEASELIDPMLKADSDCLENIVRCVHIALLCVQENVGSRPTMAAVVQMLQSLTLTLPTPSEPGFFSDTEIVVSHASNNDRMSYEASNSCLHPR